MHVVSGITSHKARSRWPHSVENTTLMQLPDFENTNHTQSSKLASFDFLPPLPNYIPYWLYMGYSAREVMYHSLCLCPSFPPLLSIFFCFCWMLLCYVCVTFCPPLLLCVTCATTPH